ncbi:MAG: hypothetical protein U0414_09770 [Polyangiaceae bacterium]
MGGRRARAALLRPQTAASVAQDLLHDPRSERVEVIPRERRAADRALEPEIGLVDELGRVQHSPAPRARTSRPAMTLSSR